MSVSDVQSIWAVAPTPRATIRSILAGEAAKAGVRIEDILGPARGRNVVAARHAAVRGVHAAFPGKGASEIGRIFRRHHTTILYALGVVKGRAGA